MAFQIVIAMMTTSLFLAVEHWFPWKGVFGRSLRFIERYVAGMLAVLIPITVLLVLWESWMELAAIWAVVITGGTVVVGSYLVDGHVSQKQRMEAAEAVERKLRDGTFE
jgi:hypothetical protein